MYFTQNLTFLTRTHSDSQMNMNSVERVLEYCNVPQEKYQPETTLEPGSGSGSDSSSTPLILINQESSEVSNTKTEESSKDSILPSIILSDYESNLPHPLPALSLRDSALTYVSTVTPMSAQPRAFHLFVPDDWPSQGKVVFDGLSMRYRDNTPSVLRLG